MKSNTNIQNILFAFLALNTSQMIYLIKLFWIVNPSSNDNGNTKQTSKLPLAFVVKKCILKVPNGMECLLAGNNSEDLFVLILLYPLVTSNASEINTDGRHIIFN